MKHLHPTLILIILTLTACVPATSAVPSPIPTPLASAQATNQPAPTSSAQISPAASVTPKGTYPQRTPTSSDPSFIASPILGRPTDTSITVNVVPASALTIFYEYGTVSGEYSAQTAPQTAAVGTPLETLIDQLQPNTRYYYRIRYGDKAGPESSFMTQRAPGSTFSFTIDADPHNRDPRFTGDLYATTLANALADRPDFHINLGDTFMTEKAKPQTYADAEATFTEMRPYFSVLGADVPLFLVNGNHEGELGWLLGSKDNSLPIWSTQLRQRYYPNPTPNGFYTGSATPDLALGGVAMATMPGHGVTRCSSYSTRSGTRPPSPNQKTATTTGVGHSAGSSTTGSHPPWKPATPNTHLSSPTTWLAEVAMHAAASRRRVSTSGAGTTPMGHTDSRRSDLAGASPFTNCSSNTTSARFFMGTTMFL